MFYLTLKRLLLLHLGWYISTSKYLDSVLLLPWISRVSIMGNDRINQFFKILGNTTQILKNVNKKNFSFLSSHQQRCFNLGYSFLFFPGSVTQFSADCVDIYFVKIHWCCFVTLKLKSILFCFCCYKLFHVFSPFI